MMQNNFNGGIISPVMFGRVDQQKYQSGLAGCKNFLVLPHGAVDYRNGFEYVTHNLGQNKKQRIIPFIFYSFLPFLFITLVYCYLHFELFLIIFHTTEAGGYSMDCLARFG